MIDTIGDSRFIPLEEAQRRLALTSTEFFKKYIDSKKVVIAKDFTDDTISGSHGDPTLATKEKGRGVVESLVSELVTFIEDLKAV